MHLGKKQFRVSTFRIIIFSFATTILFGALLLSLPISSRDGKASPFFDSLFTSTSAVCVTGLVVKDTWTSWSVFGRTVIMLLIQAGGLGVVTIAVLISAFSGRRVSLAQRSVMKEAISAEKIGGILNLTSYILKFTLLAELMGAALLLPKLAQAYGLVKGAGYAIFHSVSAFCNAGFDLFGQHEKYSSLTGYSSSALVTFTIMALIITGGIGFATWDDIRKNKLKVRRYRLQTKVILLMTALLIALPAVYFFFFEFSGLDLKERILNSLFQAVTPRTAGFNTVDEASLTHTGQMVTIMLMLIGGAPGSTAGGMKITTAAVLLASAIAVFRSKESTDILNRRLSNEVIRKAAALFLMYISLFLVSAMAISSIEELPLISCMFETASAIGTVGLTLGITPTLSAVSRGILIFLMFFGRAGGLTVMFATVSYKSECYTLPKEDVSVG